jgi:hypothetical protein
MNVEMGVFVFEVLLILVACGPLLAAKHSAASLLLTYDNSTPIRCWDGAPSSEFQSSKYLVSHDGFLSTESGTCHACRVSRRSQFNQPKDTPNGSEKDDPSHIDESLSRALLILPYPVSGTWLSLMTGLLLSRQFHVTILKEQPHNQSGSVLEHQDIDALRLRSAILSGIPCDDRARETVHKQLVIWNIIPSCNGGNDDSYPHHQGSVDHFNTCGIQDFPSITHRVSEVWKPDVVLTDASWIGSFWMAEQWNLPTVSVASHPFSIPPLIVEPRMDWMPLSDLSWWPQIPSLLRQRWYSAGLTAFFMRLNKKRRELKLPHYRQPLEHLASSVAILSEFGISPVPTRTRDVAGDDHYQHQHYSTTSGRKSNWDNIHITGPILPPCNPCVVHDTASGSTSTSTPPLFQSSSTTKIFRSAWRDTMSTASTTSSKTAKIATSKSHSIILVVPPTDPSALTIRTLIQGLYSARSSLLAYDECDWDSLHCQKAANGFKIKWFDSFETIENNNRFFPPVTSADFSREYSISLLDSVARYHHPSNNNKSPATAIVLVILPCQDRNARILPMVFGISVLCFDHYPYQYHQSAPPIISTTAGLTDDRQRMARLLLTPDTNHREVAARILHLLRNRQQLDHQQKTKKAILSKTNSHGRFDGRLPFDGLERAVSIIQRIAEANRAANRHPWMNLAEMQNVLSHAVHNLTKKTTTHRHCDHNEDSQSSPSAPSPFDTLTVFLAWSILVASMLYIMWQELLISFNGSLWRRTHHHHSFTNSTAASAKIDTGNPVIRSSRCPDLDDAWNVWLDWYRDQPDSWRSVMVGILRGTHPEASPSSTTAETILEGMVVAAIPPTPLATAPNPPTPLHPSPSRPFGPQLRRRKRK